jgi:hypothetical protein
MHAESGHFRMKINPVTILINGIPRKAQPPAEAKWLAKASSDDVVADVLSYLRGRPDWFDLYKAFERMRDDINRALGRQHRQTQMGWPAKTQLDTFQLSANVYRHSPVKWDLFNPSTAMPLEDAAAFIRRLARIWLDWRQTEPTELARDDQK